MASLSANAKFFESGGTFLVAANKDMSEAIFAAHPTAKGKLVADVMPGLDKALAELGNCKDSYVPNFPNVLATPRDDNFAIVRKSDKTGLWVVAQVSRSEAMASHRATLIPFLDHADADHGRPGLVLDDAQLGCEAAGRWAL